MTENEAIERIKTMAFMCDDFHNCKYGHDCTDGCSEAVKMAVDALQGSINKHIGKDNMVISSSDLMKILNIDEKEIRNKAIDEFRSAILQKFTEEERNGNYRFYSCELKQGIADLAEQLKGGV